VDTAQQFLTGSAAAESLIGVWGHDWLLSLPLIVLTVLLHASVLTALHHRLGHFQKRWVGRRYSLMAVALGVNVLVLILMHAIEAGMWAVVYVAVGAMPDVRIAMLYSLSALTSYGHAAVFLAPRWQMMGAIESLNGMLLLGLSTAYLFFLLHTLWGLRDQEQR
jgi:hypothetical protein